MKNFSYTRILFADNNPPINGIIIIFFVQCQLNINQGVDLEN